MSILFSCFQYVAENGWYKRLADFFLGCVNSSVPQQNGYFMETYRLGSPDKAFREEVEARSEQVVKNCYQCGNCTAGCPYTFVYEHSVSQIMRLVQSGQKEAVLNSRSLWFCASCQSCTTRCPNEIDVARVMDVCRHMAREAGNSPVRNVKMFTDAFLGSVERHGRAFELGLMASFVRRTGQAFTNMDIAPKALLRQKLGFTPHKIKGREEIKNIFERYRQGGDHV